MDRILVVMLLVSLTVLFTCGYYVGVLKEKYGKTLLHVVPISVAILMVIIVRIITGISITGSW